MSLVIDASILAAWFLAEKSDPRVEAAFDTVTRVETLAPSLFYFEMRNALLVSEKRDRITEAVRGVPSPLDKIADPDRSCLKKRSPHGARPQAKAYGL